MRGHPIKPTRQFFRKGRAAKAEKLRPKPTPPTGQVLVTTRHGQTRIMGAAEVARQRGRSKGGQAIHALGVANVFTTETAKAARKRHYNRLGYEIKRPPYGYIRTAKARVAHQWLHDAALLTEGTWYDPTRGCWFGIVRLTERTALSRLGYGRPKTKHHMPVRIIKPLVGTPPASGQRRNPST